MTYKPDYEATFAHFDEREAKILCMLPHLKNTLNAIEYKLIEKKYAKELMRMDTRRRIIQAVERQELVAEIREAFSARGILITGSKQ